MDQRKTTTWDRFKLEAQERKAFDQFSDEANRWALETCGEMTRAKLVGLAQAFDAGRMWERERQAEALEERLISQRKAREEDESSDYIGGHKLPHPPEAEHFENSRRIKQ